MKNSFVLMTLESRATTRMGTTGRQTVSQCTILATVVTHHEGPELLNSLTGQPSVWDATFLFRKINTSSKKAVSNDQPFTQCLLYVRHMMLSPYQALLHGFSQYPLQRDHY